MKLRRLNIERLPGIADGFTLTDLDAGLNVVLGPNASGKSSICRAVRALLYANNTEGPVSLDAEFADAEGTLEVILQGPDARWSRDGQEAKRPPLPDESLISCFTVQLEDLLSEGKTEDEIRERIAKILAGGYDVEAVRRLERFHTRPLHAKKEARELREAARAFRAARSLHEGLQAQEKRLDKLRERKAAADRECARIVSLDTALELLDHRRQAEVIERELAEFPPDMDRLSGDEATRLAEHRSTLEGQRARLAAIEEEGAAAVETLARNGLDEREPSPAALEDQRQLVNELRTIEQDRRSTNEALTVARNALAVAVRELGGKQPAEETRITPDKVRRAEEGLREKRELDAKAAAIDEQLALFDSADVDDAKLKRTRQARDALAQWLASPDWTTAPRPVTWPWVVMIYVAAFPGIAVAAWRVHWALAFLALIVLVAGIALLRPPTPPSDRRGAARAAFLDCGLPELEPWTAETVRDRLGELETDIVVGERARDEARRRKQLERAQESIRPRSATVAKGLSELASELGFSPKMLDSSFDRWVHLVESYDAARKRIADLESQRDGLAGKEHKLRSALVEFLARFGESQDDAAAAADRLDSALRRLVTRRGEHDEARSTVARTEREGKNVLEEIRRTEDSIASVYGGVELEPGDDAELARRLELREDWKKAHNRRRGKTEVLLNAEQRLGDNTELLALVVAGDESELRTQRELARELAGEQESLSKEIVRIEGSVERARAGRELEQARSRLAECTALLNQRFEEQRFASAAGLLLDGVEQQHVDETRPEVLRRAEEWFARFTRDAYTLKAHAPRRETFLVRESSTGEDRTPYQLSSGTRMQLFLALRLAFALEAERDRESLPFFLDEALTISDPERFDSIVDCLHLFAREQDRQVFYLTSQPHDVRAWGELDPQPKLIKLHEIRRMATAITEPSDLELASIDEIPSSEGRTPAEYGKLLCVPRVALWGEATKVHLFHLLRDELQLLERLLNRGIRTVGQLHSLLDSGHASVFLTSDEQEDLRWRTALVYTFLEACRHGRGQPVDREVLAGSGISAKYVSQFASLAGELNGDAKALLKTIDAKEDERVKRFRGDHRAQLETYLEENGHFGSGSTLVAREIELRVQHAATADVERGTTTRAKVAELTRFLMATVPTD